MHFTHICSCWYVWERCHHSHFIKAGNEAQKTWILVLALGPPAVWHWASHLTPLRLHFFVVKMGPGSVLLTGLLQGLDEAFDSLWFCHAWQTGFTGLKSRSVPYPTRATYTEDVQQDGSVLALLIGEEVCGELMNRWKTRRHDRVSVIRGPPDQPPLKSDMGECRPASDCPWRRPAASPPSKADLCSEEDIAGHWITHKYARTLELMFYISLAIFCWSMKHFTLTRMVVIKKIIASVLKDLEILELSYPAGGDVKWCSHFGKSSGCSSKG